MTVKARVRTLRLNDSTRVPEGRQSSVQTETYLYYHTNECGIWAGSRCDCKPAIVVETLELTVERLE